MVDREFLRGFTKLYALWRDSKRDAYGMAILKESGSRDLADIARIDKAGRLTARRNRELALIPD